MTLQLAKVVEGLISNDKLIRLEILPSTIKINIRVENPDRPFLIMPYMFHHGADEYRYKDSNTIYIVTTIPEDACHMVKEFIYVRM